MLEGLNGDQSDGSLCLLSFCLMDGPKDLDVMRAGRLFVRLIGPFGLSPGGSHPNRQGFTIGASGMEVFMALRSLETEN
jgi:hypothetical protein